MEHYRSKTTFLKLLFLVCCISTSVAQVYTSRTCFDNCNPTSTPLLSKWRTLGNKVNADFKGFADCWASNDANTFTTDLVVTRGQAWPRISEGRVVPEQRSKRYEGLTVNKYIRNGNHAIQYSGKWLRRQNGDDQGYKIAPCSPCGAKRYNGAYIWLNDKENVERDSNGKKIYGSPKWPFTREINIWNRHGGVDTGPNIYRYNDYVQGPDTYKVTGGMVSENRGGVSFFAYFVVKTNYIEDQDDMNINVSELLKHLKRQDENRDYFIGDYEIIEIAVAAEGHKGTDGKFQAYITQMGEP